MTYSPIYTSTTMVYTKTGLTSSQVNLSDDTTVQAVIQDAEQEVEYLTGRQWTTGNTKTDIINGPQNDIIGYNGSAANSINLSEYPVQSITSFTVVDVDDNVIATYANLTSVQIAAGTFDTSDYWLNTVEDALTHTIIPYGKITLKAGSTTTSTGIQGAFPPGTANIKVAYTYGYGTVPVAIRNLATCLAGLRAWVLFMGGSYNFYNSYSVPEQNVSKGDFYARCKQNMDTLREEADRLLDRIGRRPRRLFFATGGGR